MAILIHDKLAATLVPMAVLVHTLAREARGGSFVVTELEGHGDVTSLDDAGMLALEANLPRRVSWDWIETLARVISDVVWLDLKGTLGDGSPVRLRCLDSTYWVVEASPEVEQRVGQRFEVVTRQPEAP